jgi:type IV secretory pathway VirB4 component
VILKKLIDKYGDDPENWLKIFYKKAAELSK